MEFFGMKFISPLVLAILACFIICTQAAPRPAEDSETKKPSIPGVGINTGFDEIVVESSLNVRNKNPEKRQSKPRLIIPHMIPKKFGEAANSKYTHTEDPMMDKVASTSKPSKPVKKATTGASTTTTTTTEKSEETTANE